MEIHPVDPYLWVERTKLTVEFSSGSVWERVLQIADTLTVDPDWLVLQLGAPGLYGELIRLRIGALNWYSLRQIRVRVPNPAATPHPPAPESPHPPALDLSGDDNPLALRPDSRLWHP